MHIPVLQKEVLECLNPKPNENFIDCTFGEGGHTSAILEKNGPKGKVLGIEADSELHKKLSTPRKKERRLKLVQDSYVNLKEIVKKAKIRPISGILLDLGMSSWHLSESERGFTFKRNQALDMRYNLEDSLTAEKILNFWSKQSIEEIIREYGEERYARIIAERIVEQRKIRPIKTTFQLVEIIKEAVHRRYLRERIHFATRTFQALRITVNDELNNLEKVLPQASEILKKNGRLVIISFHSLEDRIVKNFFRDQASSLKFYETKLRKAKEGLPAPHLGKACSSGPRIKILTKKPIRPTPKEIQKNPRSRSAKLRAAIKQ